MERASRVLVMRGRDSDYFVLPRETLPLPRSNRGESWLGEAEASVGGALTFPFPFAFAFASAFATLFQKRLKVVAAKCPVQGKYPKCRNSKSEGRRKGLERGAACVK